MNTSETIAAIATSLSESGISIIRVSGPVSIDIVNKLFFTPSGKQILLTSKSHTIHYGSIFSLSDHILIDDCLVSVFLAPKSYTGENVVEINCHGGVFITKKILNEVLSAGARLAEPGEFTKRAFLNGKLDLAEAEAVMDVISAKNDASLKASVNQLSGSVSKAVKELRSQIIYEIAFIESALDDPEHISLDGYSDRLSLQLSDWLSKINDLILSNDSGRFLRDGIKTVLLGKPNAGKSSIMNLLLGEERAIVTDIAGTTRDILEEYIKLDDFGIDLIDTAGLRDTDSIVEQIGVDRAKKAADNADLIIYVIDFADKDSVNSFNRVSLDNIISLYSEKKVIFLLNKTDIFDFNSSDFTDVISYIEKLGYPVIPFSAKTGFGVDKLKSSISSMFLSGLGKNNDEVVITNIRHRKLLEECLSSLLNVQNSLNNNMEEDFLSIDLMDAYTSLGKIIGEEIEDDLATEIFSKFCLGK